MNNLSAIKNRKYSGYIWMSDEKEPKILNDEEFVFSTIGTNPFIIEALLYCKEENVSLTIRHTGKYHIHEIQLNKYTNENLVDIAYLPHRLKDEKKAIDVKKVCFKQLWTPENDANCEGWPVLKMKALVFTGFELKN